MNAELFAAVIERNHRSSINGIHVTQRTNVQLNPNRSRTSSTLTYVQTFHPFYRTTITDRHVGCHGDGMLAKIAVRWSWRWENVIATSTDVDGTSCWIMRDMQIQHCCIYRYTTKQHYNCCCCCSAVKDCANSDDRQFISLTTASRRAAALM